VSGVADCTEHGTVHGTVHGSVHGIVHSVRATRVDKGHTGRAWASVAPLRSVPKMIGAPPRSISMVMRLSMSLTS
jgi:hypothetical protein